MDQFVERANQAFAGILGDSLNDGLKLPNQWINITETAGEGKNNGKVYEKSLPDFKKPEVSRLKRNECVPGHLLNPEKWTRYDLSDVKLSSDSANAQSALSFLNNLKKRKHSSASDISSNKEDDNHIMFTKLKSAVGGNDETEASKCATASFTVVMPEYTIGSKKKKVIKKTCLGAESNSSTHKMLKLSHLENDEDDIHEP